MFRKRRVKKDESVIKTERDTRRAAKEDDETWDEDTDAQQQFNVPPRYITTPAESIYLRTKTRKTIRRDEEILFPFLLLPAEIRNMIYRYLVLSKSGKPIRLDQVTSFVPGGIETAILRTNKLLYAEAAKLMYDENKFEIYYERYPNLNAGLSYRVDSTKSETARVLRSGREVDMMKHTGLIYPKVFHRLRHVQFHIEVFDRSRICDHLTMYWAFDMYEFTCKLRNTIIESSTSEFRDLRIDKSHWSVVIHSQGVIGWRSLRRMLRPIQDSQILTALYKGHLKVTLTGTFPKKWKSVFDDMMQVSSGFESGEVVELDEPDLDPEMLNEYFSIVCSKTERTLGMGRRFNYGTEVRRRGTQQRESRGMILEL